MAKKDEESLGSKNDVESIDKLPGMERAGREGNIQLKSGALGIEETRGVLKGQKKYKIMIPSTETEKGDVSVGINGYTFVFQRDKEIVVPEGVVEVLNNAKADVFDQVKSKDGFGYELVPRQALRYPFQILKEMVA